MTCHETHALDPCSFLRDDYAFAGWNTEQDGSGANYADGAEVVDLATEAGSTVTLHAQWEPLAYTVELLLTDDDGATTSLGSIAATFDAPLTLPEKAEGIPDDAVLLGWETLGLGSFYRTGSQETNLCTLASDGAPVGRSLYALLGATGEFYLSIEDNGTPVALEDPASEIELVAESGAAFGGFSAIGSGVYSASDIPPGTYSVAIAG